MAYDDGYYYGQCKIVAVVDNTEDNGKTVLITTDDNKTYSGTIANKKCEFLLPPRTLYTVQKVSSGSAEFTTKVEAGYGDCILVHLDTGYVEVKQGDIVGLDYIKAATDDNLKNKVPEAKAVKELNNSLGGFTPIIDSTGKITGYKTKVGADTVFPFSSVANGTFTFIHGGSSNVVDTGLSDINGFVYFGNSSDKGWAFSGLYLKNVDSTISNLLGNTAMSESSTEGHNVTGSFLVTSSGATRKTGGDDFFIRIDKINDGKVYFTATASSPSMNRLSVMWYAF